MIEFYKYQGTGNDFVMIDNRQNNFDNKNLSEIRKICDRRFGVGADGLILIEKSSKTDFYVNYFNSDGSKSFCGNGARCSIAFAKFLGIIDDHTTFEAIDGVHEATIQGDQISLKMSDVLTTETGDDFHFIDTGSPHYIRFVEDVEEVNVVDFGRKIRYSDRFKKKGTNVNVAQINNEELIVRTYERGVEDETFSCGTGATAVALAYFEKQEVSAGNVKVLVKGGTLFVKAEKEGNGFKNVWLIGPGEQVYRGEWTIS